MNIETLYVMPQMVRVEGSSEDDSGYEYPEKVQNSIFIINEKIVIFEKRKYHECSLALVTALVNIISKEFITSEDLVDFKETIINEVSEQFNKDDELRNGLISLERNSLDKISELQSNLNHISNNIKKYAAETVNAELEIVYKNFETAIANIVKEEVDKIKQEINLSENKLKPAQIMLYKEMGLPLEDIIKLKQQNLL